MTIEIMNMRRESPSEPYDFIIDRTTPLGNPLSMGRENRRNLVCDAFDELGPTWPGAQEYLMEILLALREYGKVRLFCWCAPKRCHGETIKKWLEAQQEDAS